MFPSIFNASEQNQTSISAIVKNYLAINNYVFESNNVNTVFSLRFNGDNGIWQTLFFVNEKKAFLQIKSICPITSRDNKKLLLSELFNRLNSNILFGNFILDFEDGEIAFKTTQLLKNTLLNNDVLDILFKTNISTIEEYLPAISAVNSGFVEPCLAAQ